MGEEETNEYLSTSRSLKTDKRKYNVQNKDLEEIIVSLWFITKLLVHT